MEIAHGKLLSNVIRDRPELEFLFAGGTSPPDKYEEGSLALIYKSLLGASVNLREYYFLKVHGKEPKTICTISKTDLLNYVDHLSVLLRRVLDRACETGLITQAEVRNAQEDSEKAALEILAEPDTLPNKFVGFLNKALGLTVAYNEYTRFIWHLRKIPKKYMMEFYPEMRKSEVFKFLQELLGLREYIVPQVEDPEIVDLYTIFSFDYAIKMTFPTRAGYSDVDGIRVNIYQYSEGKLPESKYEPYTTIGGCLCRVNELIWGFFKSYEVGKSLRLIITEVPDPFDHWKNMAVSELPDQLISKLNYPIRSYHTLSVLDEYLPAIFTGRVELIKEETGECLHLIRRW